MGMCGVCFVIERKDSKGSIAHSDEIVTADSQAVATAANTNTTTTTSLAGVTSTVIAPPKVTVHEENERTGESIDVSDTSK